MEKFCRFNGKAVHYTITGEGDAILFLHGFLEDLSLWKNIVAEFSGKYKIICIDLPGHGKTEVFGEVHSMNLMADVAAAVIKKENAGRVIVIGHSMGGYAALAFGKRYGDLCRGIVLLNSTAAADSEEKKADRLRAVKVAEKSMSLFVSESIPKLFSPDNSEKFNREIEEMKEIAASTSVPGTIASIRGMMEREDSYDFLDTTPIPTLFIAGKKDAIIPESSSVQQIKRFENSKGYILENSGHLSVIEEMEAVIFLLKSFFAEISAGKR